MINDCHELYLPGEIEVGPGEVCPVTIAELSESGCRLSEAVPQLAADIPVLLWLSAIGPFRAHVSPAAPTRMEFDGKIHPAIVKHFLA